MRLGELHLTRCMVTHCVGDLHQTGIDATDRGEANMISG